MRRGDLGICFHWSLSPAVAPSEIHAQSARRLLSFLIQILQRGGDLIDRRVQSLEQATPGVRQRHAARRAVEEAYATRSSSRRIVWLSAEGVTPSRAAAARKLRFSATMMNAVRSARSPRRMAEFLSLPMRHIPDFTPVSRHHPDAIRNQCRKARWRPMKTMVSMPSATMMPIMIGTGPKHRSGGRMWRDVVAAWTLAVAVSLSARRRDGIICASQGSEGSA